MSSERQSRAADPAPRGIVATIVTGLAIWALASGPALAQQIALTWDDLPAHSAVPRGETQLGVAARIVAAMADAGSAPSYGFVNGARLEETSEDRTRVLALWRAAGHPLGNHGWSHANLDAVGAARFLEEVDQNEEVLERYSDGMAWRWLRYPFLAEGGDPEVRDAVRRGLKARGYSIASVTMDFSDWAWNEPYVRCLDKADDEAVAWLESTYLRAAEQAFDASVSLSRQLYGDDIPYVLLMHAGAFDARMAPRLLAFYRSRGVEFVSLDAAMSHPFYAADLAAESGGAPLTLENAAAARGIAPPPRESVLTELAAVCR